MSEQEMRELDAWIAEKVMGFPLLAGPTYQAGPIVDSTSNDAIQTYQTFTPTTSPAAAMMVLEKCALVMREGVYGYDITIQNRGGRWSVTCWKELSIEIEADTLPLAICLFARALFGKDEQ